MQIRISLFVLAACGNAAPTTQGAAPTPTPAAPAVLRATDVTQRDSMLAATSVGGHGELLPANLYEVPLLDQRDGSVTDPKQDRQRLRVVAARYEPCRGSFGSPTEASCVNQLRLVFQVF